MKLQAPEGLSSFQHNSVDIEIGDDGIAEVTNNPELVSAMLSHGFTEVVEETDDEQPTQPARAKRKPR